MFWSEELRKTLINNERLPANILEYAWTPGFLNKMKFFYVNAPKLSLYRIFELGLNIGRSSRTCKDLVKMLRFCYPISKFKVRKGIFAALAGTKNCPNGNHVWIEDSNSIFDPILMITLPKGLKEALGYVDETSTQETLPMTPRSFDNYKNEYFKLSTEEYEVKYQSELLKIV